MYSRRAVTGHSAGAATGATAMARLVVRVPGGTGFGTEALAIAQYSLGSLHLTGATGAGAGGSGSHHNQSTHCCIGQKKTIPETAHHSQTQIRGDIDNDSHAIRAISPAT